MAEDKLFELRQISEQNHLKINIEDDNREDQHFLGNFNENQQKLQDILKRVKANNESIVDLKQQYQHATTSAKEKEISTSLNSIIYQNNSLNQAIKDILTNLNEDVEKAKKEMPDDPETRMKANIYNALNNKTKEVLKDSQNVQLDFKAGLKDKVSRQARYIDNTLNDDQVDEIVNDPEKGNQLLQEKMYGTASIQLQNAVSDIQDKYRDIKKLENSVNTVYQLFVDLALLVQQQGEMLDNIELNVNDAKNYVGKAEVNLKKAKEYHMAAKKVGSILKYKLSHPI